MKERIMTSDLFDIEKTIAKDIFNGITYPWEVLPLIKDFIPKLGAALPCDKFYLYKENVWIAKSCKLYPNIYIDGPCIIDEDTEVRPGAFIRGSVIVGKGCVVGNSTELKNCILFDSVQVPHFNYVGDSVMGYKSHIGAGGVTSNVKSDKSLVVLSVGDEKIETGYKKFGAMVGDFVEVGCNSVLNPGTIIGRNSNIYPTSCVRGFVPEGHIFKAARGLCKKHN
ncbi:MAG: UDP-N-acetylglucosamine pyrophosphorylase [Clostridia bacterium]|nr:UDP-N-acetylglucosamine pyrophosphorylase [Clostridia bacterium]